MGLRPALLRSLARDGDADASTIVGMSTILSSSTLFDMGVAKSHDHSAAINTEREVFAAEELLAYFESPERSLHIRAHHSICDAGEIHDERYFSLHCTRSYQGQLALTSLVQHRFYRGRLISEAAKGLSESVHQRILECAQSKIAELSWRGSSLLRFDSAGEFLDLTRGVQREALWTLDHCLTSGFENELRACFDLPLGSVEVTSRNWMTIEFSAPGELDMVRPYLHLCARNPRYKFHHFDSHSGVISLSDENVDVEEDLFHALDYLEGIINE